MARPKKPTYEYVERLGTYRKRIKDADGKYVAIYAKDPDELTRKIAAAQASIAAQQSVKGNPTVAQYAEEWLALYTKDMPSNTSNVYKNAVKVHIAPQLGAMRVRDVTPNDAMRVLVQMTAKSASMQSKTLNTMRKIFDSAVENGLALKNPCTKLRAGGKKSDEKTPLSAEQVNVLIDAVKGTRAETFIMIGLYAGLRREEILGLRWDCVHLDGAAPHVSIKRALRWEHNRPLVSAELKTPTARRNIPIPPQLSEYLLPLQGEADAYVVGGAPLTYQQFRNLWRIVERRQVGEATYLDGDGEKITFVRKRGAKSRSAPFSYTIDFYVTPHTLRHTYITNLILAGVDLKSVQYLAGHSDPKVTLKIYTHLVQNKPEDMILKVTQAFSKPKS